MRPRVDLHVGTLVLQGLDGVDSASVGDAVVRHLAALVAANGVPSRSAVVPRVAAGSFRLARGAPADTVGAQVARAVYRGVRR